MWESNQQVIGNLPHSSIFLTWILFIGLSTQARNVIFNTVYTSFFLPYDSPHMWELLDLKLYSRSHYSSFTAFMALSTCLNLYLTSCLLTRQTESTFFCISCKINFGRGKGINGYRSSLLLWTPIWGMVRDSKCSHT